MAKVLNNRLIILAITLILIGCQPTTNTIALVNDSSSVIQKATIQVSGQSFFFENLPPSEQRSFSFRVGGDSDYSVKIVFLDGKELNKKQLGYVTSGVNSQDVIHVKDTDITLENIGRKFN